MSWPRAARNSGPNRDAASLAIRSCRTCSTMRSYQPSARSSKPSARVTTPTGNDAHPRIGGRCAQPWTPRPTAAFASIQQSSVDPPPMSITSAKSWLASTRSSDPSSAYFASSFGVIVSIFMPSWRWTWLRKALPLLAARQACVAMYRVSTGSCFFTLSRHRLSASIARPIAFSESIPVRASPSPSLTICENESTTRRPPDAERSAISSRQLFVPRSSAA